MGSRGCGLRASPLREGGPRLSFNISQGLQVGRAALMKVLTAAEGGWGWGAALGSLRDRS